MIYYIILLIFILISLSKIVFNVRNVKNETNVSFKFLYIFNFKMDYKKFVSHFSIKKDKELINQINNLYNNIPLFRIILSQLEFKKVEIIKLINLKNELTIYDNLIFLSTSKILETYLRSKALKVISYMSYIKRYDDYKNEYDFEVEIKFSFYRLYYILSKLLILKLRRKTNGSSNKYPVKG